MIATTVEDPRADLRWGTIPALLADVSARMGNQVAVIDSDRTLTYGELAVLARQVSRGLIARGVEPGDRVAIWAPNRAGWVVAALGVLNAGAVLVTLNTRFKGGEAAHILRTSGTKLLFCVRGFLGSDYPALLDGQDIGDLRDVVVLHEAERLASTGAPHQFNVLSLEEFLSGGESVAAAEAEARATAVVPTDLSDLLFTSGTTGAPKGAMSTHAQVLRTFGTWAAIVGFREGDRYLIVNPFFHSFGLKAGIIASLLVGATIVPEPVFDVDAVLRRIDAERITVLPGPPALYQSLLTHPDRASHDLSSLRLGVTGAAVVPVELVRAMSSTLGFDTVLTAYGLTESCGVATMCRRGDPPDVVAHTSGRAIPGLEVSVVDAAGLVCGAGEPGEVVVRGYPVMTGYWNDDAATSSALDPDGWLHTGDIGCLSAAGNLTITDRLKDVYIVGGFNAYPAEIEGILRGVAGVGAIAVIGVPDERLGEVGCAWIVPSDEGGEGGEGREEFANALFDAARETMANFKVPRFVVLVDALPVNASSKVLKRELRQRFADGAPGCTIFERK